MLQFAKETPSTLRAAYYKEIFGLGRNYVCFQLAAVALSVYANQSHAQSPPPRQITSGVLLVPALVPFKVDAERRAF